MKLKNIALVVVFLAAASAGVWYSKRGDSETPGIDPRVGKPLVDKTILVKVAGVLIHSDNKDINLTDTAAPGAASAAWVVREYHDLPADFEKLSSLVREISEAKVTRFGSARPERMAGMAFEEGTRIELRDKDAKPLLTLHLGASIQSGGRYIKFNDEARAYVAQLSAYLETTPKSWAEARLIGAKADQIVGIEAKFPGGATIAAKREKAGAPWMADSLAPGESLKDSELTSLASRLADLRFSETGDVATQSEVAAREGARTFKVTIADGRTLTVLASKRPTPPAPVTPTPAPDAAAPAEGGAEITSDPTPPAAAATPPPAVVDAYVTSSTATDAINTSMTRRGFQIAEWTYSSFPADRAALVQFTPPPAPETPAAPVAPTP